MKTLMSTLDFTLDYIEPKRLCSLKAYVDVSIKTAIDASHESRYYVYLTSMVIDFWMSL